MKHFIKVSALSIDQREANGLFDLDQMLECGNDQNGFWIEKMTELSVASENLVAREMAANSQLSQNQAMAKYAGLDPWNFVAFSAVSETGTDYFRNLEDGKAEMTSLVKNGMDSEFYCTVTIKNRQYDCNNYQWPTL